MDDDEQKKSCDSQGHDKQLKRTTSAGLPAVGGVLDTERAAKVAVRELTAHLGRWRLMGALLGVTRLG